MSPQSSLSLVDFAFVPQLQNEPQTLGNIPGICSVGHSGIDKNI